MITPQFQVSQDNDFVFIEIRAPYIKASLIQFEVEGERFVFSLPPYYLRLRFPGNLVEDDRMESRYDLATSTVHCRVAKQVPGEHFPDLDMLSKLLAAKPTTGPKPKPIIEELDQQGPHLEGPLDPKDMPTLPTEDIDWEMEQKLPEPGLQSSVKYGFNNQYNEIVGLSLAAGNNDVNELGEPEKETILERYATVEAAAALFDVDHYFADLYENPMLDDLLAYHPAGFELSASDRDVLMKLPKRTYLLEDAKQTYLGLIQLLFGFCYDDCLNTGDPTVESAWTVGKLCPMMACLYNSYQRVDGLVVDCSKRALIFPLCRNFELIVKVWQDVHNVLKAGRSAVMSRLIKLCEIFENEVNNCYRQIWLEDYTVWVQYASDAVIDSLAQELDKTVAQLKKKDLGLELEEYEEAAQEVMDADPQEIEALAEPAGSQPGSGPQPGPQPLDPQAPQAPAPTPAPAPLIQMIDSDDED